MTELNAEEKRAISALHRVAKKWPKSLWLFANGQALYVMQKNPDGSIAETNGSQPGFNGDAAVATINIESDGGDF